MLSEKKGKWAVKKEKFERASGLYSTQAKALKEGRLIAKREKSELVIHDRKNRIRDKDSYDNDPCPSKDKKY